jgi:hypothetical protein
VAQGLKFPHLCNTLHFLFFFFFFKHSHPNVTWHLMMVSFPISQWLVSLSNSSHAYWPFIYLFRTNFYSCSLAIFKRLFIVIVELFLWLLDCGFFAYQLIFEWLWKH